MAEALSKVLIGNLNSLIQREVGVIMGVDKEMRKLFNTLTTIYNVLEDAEDRQFHDRSIQFWLGQLNDMAFEIEDILDDCNIHFSQLMKPKGGSNFFNKLKKVPQKRKIGKRIKKAAEKLDAIAKDRHNFHLKESNEQKQRDCRRETGSILNDPDHVYGRDEEKEKIVDILVNQVSEQRLSVLPIIGIGGMGKTTLAQFIFNDDRVTHHFNTKVWVCVSDHYDLIAILKAIIESATGGKPNLDNLDSLQRRLRQELNEKRYLLILDDVWNEDQEDWDKLKSILACGSLGSSIVVTTRLQKVASIMVTTPLVAHNLKELSEENCWLLFWQRAFGHENGQCHGNLEAIGRRIVKKCGGVPLAAKALGGLLRFQRDEKEWTHVDKSDMWNLPQEENSILPVLRLSYRHLPFVLKRCFVYCAVFPKDHTFDKTELIFHWMAHGCISSNGTQEVEDVGDQIWNELTLRSFFQQVDTTSEGKTNFKMHDLVHELAQSIMESKNPGSETQSSSTSASNNKIREVHWSRFNSKNIFSSISVEVSTLTTIMNFNRVRILKLDWIVVEELPSAIGKLKQLRCLNLSHSSIRTLPHTFCCLYSLQILILNYCSKLESLPKNISSMTNLRHIFLKDCWRLRHMPYRIGELTCLKTLSLFIVGDRIDNQLDELEHLNLGGRLEIKHLERVKNHLIAKKANLVEKLNLGDLVLRWNRRTTSELTEMMEDEKVLEALEPHPNLVTTEIYGFRGRELAHWMKSMKNITRVCIQQCRNCRGVSGLGDLPLLKSLSLRDLNALEYIVEENEVGCEAAKFPSLEDLFLERLPNLKGWLKEGEVVQIFPNLQSLRIFGCESLRLTSGPNSVTKLDLSGCKIGSCFAEGSLQHLTALQELWIMSCTEMEEDVAEEMKHLHRLKRLTLAEVDDMVSLPQALQHIPSLQSLTLHSLGRLTSLPDWLPKLASLTQLEIICCPAIPSLPSSIQGMTNLMLLAIVECPQLKRRCEEANGEDWHKISHIPRLYI